MCQVRARARAWSAPGPALALLVHPPQPPKLHSIKVYVGFFYYVPFFIFVFRKNFRATFWKGVASALFGLSA